MKTAAMRAAASSLLVFVAGCVPLLPHSYYRPSAADGFNPQNRCWKTYETLIVRRGPGDIAIRVLEAGRGRSFVVVMFQLPAGHRARVERPDFEMVGASGVHRTIAFDGIAPNERIDGDRLPIDRVVDGATFQVAPTLIVRNYWLYASIDVAAGDDFTVALPAIEFDGVGEPLPVVRFARTTDVQVLAPLQC